MYASILAYGQLGIQAHSVNIDRAICPSSSIVKARGSGRNDAKRNPLHYSTSPLAPPGIWLAWEGTRRINHKFGAPQQQCVEPIAGG